MVKTLLPVNPTGASPYPSNESMMVFEFTRLELILLQWSSIPIPLLSSEAEAKRAAASAAAARARAEVASRGLVVTVVQNYFRGRSQKQIGGG